MTQQDEATKDLLQAVEMIKRQFLDQLDERILDLEALRKMVVTGDRAQEAMSEIAARAHKIRGVAGTFGLDSLGEAAANLDDGYHRLTSDEANGKLSAAEKWLQLSPMLERLMDQMEEALDG